MTYEEQMEAFSEITEILFGKTIKEINENGFSKEDEKILLLKTKTKEGKKHDGTNN